MPPKKPAKKKQKPSLGDFLKRNVKKPKLVTWVSNPSILLCSNIPKPMHGVSPRVVLGSKWWNATRKAAYKSTAYHCEACSVHKMEALGRKWMEGHELYDIDYQRGRMTYVRTTPLCHFCHNYIHDGRLEALLRTKKIAHQKYAAIIRHGDNILFRAGLLRKTREQREEVIIDLLLNGSLAAWGDWRLVINGREYPPKFKTEYQWKKAME